MEAVLCGLGFLGRTQDAVVSSRASRKGPVGPRPNAGRRTFQQLLQREQNQGAQHRLGQGRTTPWSGGGFPLHWPEREKCFQSRANDLAQFFWGGIQETLQLSSIADMRKSQSGWGLKSVGASGSRPCRPPGRGAGALPDRGTPSGSGCGTAPSIAPLSAARHDQGTWRRRHSRTLRTSCRAASAAGPAHRRRRPCTRVVLPMPKRQARA
jgi:hypothetical protein